VRNLFSKPISCFLLCFVATHVHAQSQDDRLSLSAASVRHLTVGAAAGKEFDGVLALFILEDGSITAITDGAAERFTRLSVASIRLPLRRPTESQGPRDVVRCADGRLVTFQPPKQFRVFSPEGSLQRTGVWPDALGGAPFRLIGCAGNDIIGALTERPARRPGLLEQSALVIATGSIDSGIVHILDTIPSAHWFRGLIQPFTPHAVAVANGESVAWGSTGDSLVTVRLAGDPTNCVQRLANLKRTSVTPALRKAWTDAFVARTPASIYEGQIKPILDSVPWPRTAPIWDELMLDNHRRLWIRAYGFPASLTETWWVYDLTSSAPKQLSLPRETSLRAVDDTTAWTTRAPIDGHVVLEAFPIKGLRNFSSRSATSARKGCQP
jgi:hypothetical protein